MDNVVFSTEPPRYEIQSDEAGVFAFWRPVEAMDDLTAAISYAERLQSQNPFKRYRVLDRKEADNT